MSTEWSRENCLKDLSKNRKRIVELSSIKIYNIIRKLHKELPVEDILCVTCLPYLARHSWGPSFYRQLRHVYYSVELNEKDGQVFGEFLDKAEKKIAEEEAKGWEHPTLPPLGIN